MRPQADRPGRSRAATGQPKLPLSALLALATAVFVTCLTEILPAGVLPAMSADLGVDESATGQTVTIYAIGTVATAIPLASATAHWPRKRLLLTAMAGFALANTVTAVSSNYPLTMVARFVAGMAGGLAWALLAGYARSLAPVPLQGRAIAIAMTGVPVALSVGVPAGAFLGATLGWRVAFLTMTLITVALLGWITVAVPDRPGRRTHARVRMRTALTVSGVAPVLLVTVCYVLGHTILYTYIATFLDRVGMGGATDRVLLVFGVAAMLGVWIVGAQVDRRLRTLMVASTVLVAVAAAILATVADQPALVYVAATLWGLGWGGVPALLQAAVQSTAGGAADAAQAMLVTLWNAATAGGGLVGGALLNLFGALAFPWSVLALLGPTLVIVLAARAHGFPAPVAVPEPARTAAG